MNDKRTLQELLSDYQPKPGKRFYQKMEAAPWVKSKETMNPYSTRPFHLGWKFAIALLLIFALLSFAIPDVRASVSAWLGLSIAPSNQMPVTAVTLVAMAPPATQNTQSAVALVPTATSPALSPTALPTQPAVQSTSSRQVPDQVNQLAPQVGWNILTPDNLPDGYQFESAYLDANHQMVVLTYTIARPLPGAADPTLTSTKSITVLQAQTNDFVPMQISPDATVNDVEVNGQPAVYVTGAWDTQFVPDANDPNGGQMVSTWRNDLPIQNIYWQVRQVFVTIVTNDDVLSQQDLIDLADSFSG